MEMVEATLEQDRRSVLRSVSELFKQQQSIGTD